MRRLLSASLILSLTLLLGRFAGFLREMHLGALLGVSSDADFAVIMLTTPDLLVNLLLSGGLSAALIPEFGRLDRGGRTRVFIAVSALVSILFGTIGILIAAFPSILMATFAPGYANVPSIQYSQIFAITALAIPLAGLAGITAALLNAEEKFFVAGAGTLVFNTTIIAALALWSTPGHELKILAIAIALAGLFRYVSQLVACLPYLSMAQTQVAPTVFSRLVLRFMQALGASTLVLFIPVILRAIVSLSGTGNIAAFNFATKLVELPLGIAITTISAVAFPALSKVVFAKDTDGERQLFADGIERSLLLSVCIAIPCFFFSHELVSLIFGRGRMKPADLQLISDLARLGFLTLPSIAVSSMAGALLNARGETGVLLKSTIVAAIFVPAIALPGVIAGNARLSTVALPVFHLVYAVVLARATRDPLFVGWRWASGNLVRPMVAAAAGTAICALVWRWADTQSAMFGSALTFGAILLSLVFAGAFSRRQKAVRF